MAGKTLEMPACLSVTAREPAGADQDWNACFKSRPTATRLLRVFVWEKIEGKPTLSGTLSAMTDTMLVLRSWSKLSKVERRKSAFARAYLFGRNECPVSVKFVAHFRGRVSEVRWVPGARGKSELVGPVVSDECSSDTGAKYDIGRQLRITVTRGL